MKTRNESAYGIHDDRFAAARKTILTSIEKKHQETGITSAPTLSFTVQHIDHIVLRVASLERAMASNTLELKGPARA